MYFELHVYLMEFRIILQVGNENKISTNLRQVSDRVHQRTWLVSCCHRALFQKTSWSTVERRRTSWHWWWTLLDGYPRKWNHRCRPAPTSSVSSFQKRTRCATSRSSSSPRYAPLSLDSSGGSPPFVPFPPRISTVSSPLLGFVCE